jgi:thiol:disulfide interchange protein DsbD
MRDVLLTAARAWLLLAVLLPFAPASAGPNDVLRPERAFPYELSTEGRDILLRWRIEPGYYLYRERMSVVALGPGVTLGAAAMPPGEPYEDEFFGRMEIYRGEVLVRIPVLAPAEGAVEVELEIRSQGCADIGLCYPPQAWPALVMLDDTAVAAANAAGDARPAAAAGSTPMVSEQDRLAGLIRSGPLALVMLSFAGFGLLLAFTPCCLPMVPILSGIIVGQGPGLTTARAFALSATYVLGMALTYTAAGALFAAAGSQLQAALQQPWIIIGVALLFGALALSMFGVYELQLPAALMNRITAASSRQRVGTFFGTAAMGALSALVVTTCVAPPLVATLTVIAGTGDITRGALALFALAIGMGLPLLVVGSSAGRLLPKAGAWMTTVKGAFGFMMLGLAVWMLDRLLPDAITLALWATLAIMAAVFLGAFQSPGPGAPAARQIARGAGLLLALYGIALLAGALGGSRNPLQPLEAFTAGARSTVSAELPFQRIKTVADFDAALAAAQASSRPVMLDFYADWCTSCIEMERYTFGTPEVRAALGDAVLLQADVTANDAADKALLARFGIFGPPTIVFFGVDGTERVDYRVVGFQDAAQFAGHVRRAFGR